MKFYLYTIYSLNPAYNLRTISLKVFAESINLTRHRKYNSDTNSYFIKSKYGHSSSLIMTQADMINFEILNILNIIAHFLK